MSIATGTVTLVFTDIEGSTRLLRELGDRYDAVLQDQRRLLREAFGARNGTEVDTAGDGLFYAFPRARDALLAAVEGQQALGRHDWPLPMRVRMGMHTGEPLSSGTGYVGLDVHRAARIMAAAHGGQVLISQATRELARDLPPEVTLLDLGDHSPQGPAGSGASLPGRRPGARPRVPAASIHGVAPEQPSAPAHRPSSAASRRSRRRNGPSLPRRC